MCIFCGDPDPFHGLGPAPVMLALAGATSGYAKLRRRGRDRLPALIGGGSGPTDRQAVLGVAARIAPMPKVELHLHLTGTLRATTVRELAARYQPDSPLADASWPDGYWTFRDLNGFIGEFRRVTRTCVRTADDFHRIARECFQDLAAQGVVYAEVSLGGRTPGVPGYVPLGEVLEVVDAARREVEKTGSFRVGLLLGINRFAPDEVLTARAVQAVEEAIRARERGVRIVGVDLDGDEQSLPDVSPVEPAFRLAAEAGLGRRAHAGEGAGPDSIRECLRRLDPQRLGHGVRAIEDPNLVAELSERSIALDVCPTANVRMGIVPTLEQHPIRALVAAGLPVTVSSDTLLAFDTTVSAELALLHDRLGFSLAELGGFQVAAAQHCFLPPDDRAALAESIRVAWPATPPLQG